MAEESERKRMQLSTRQFRRVRKQLQGAKRTELTKADVLSLRKFIHAKAREPGLSDAALRKAVQAEWGLGSKAAKKHLLAAACAKPEEEEEPLARKEAKSPHTGRS